MSTNFMRFAISLKWIEYRDSQPPFWPQKGQTRPRAHFFPDVNPDPEITTTTWSSPWNPESRRSGSTGRKGWTPSTRNFTRPFPQPWPRPLTIQRSNSRLSPELEDISVAVTTSRILLLNGEWFDRCTTLSLTETLSKTEIIWDKLRLFESNWDDSRQTETLTQIVTLWVKLRLDE